MASTQSMLHELESLRARYAPIHARRKCELLLAMGQRTIRSASQLQRLHAAACFLRAFPDNRVVLSAAREMLDTWADRTQDLTRIHRESLVDTGMAGTTVCYEFSYHTACQLVDFFQDSLEIDWMGYESPEQLDALLVHVIGQAEEQTFEAEEAVITTQEWVKLAKGRRTETDLTWLLRQARRSRTQCKFPETLYDQAEIPVVWRLGNTSGATTNNTFDTGRTVFRSVLRKPPKRPRVVIATPLLGIRLLSEERGRAMIDVSIHALAVRQREVFAMTHANPQEVYLAPLGNGAHAAIMGVVPHHRLHLEGNYGYILLSNGRPIGYGGVSPLFLQANTGINIFPEYRGGEAAFLFVQLLRAFHTLFGITRFVANPYQFGRENNEAIKSGAFWFYYKIGFRPVDAATFGLAEDEYRRILGKSGYRSDPATLRQLAKSDFHLPLSGSKRAEYFEERWLTTCAAGATAVIAAQPGIDRNRQMRRVTRRVAESIGATDWNSWNMRQCRGLERLTPTIALAADLESWTRSEKRILVRLILAKTAPQERNFVLRLGRHKRFRESLAQFCSNADAASSP